MEAERIPRGVDRALHLKLGPGGLSDVEWIVQLLQLQHAHALPSLRTTRTGLPWPPRCRPACWPPRTRPS